MTKVVVATRGCIASHDFLVVDGGGDCDVLSNWQAEGIIGVWKAKPIAAVGQTSTQGGLIQWLT